MDKLVSKIIEIAINCGNVLTEKEKNITIENKDGVGNIVTNYDKLLQNILKEKLLSLIPEATFIGEEEEFNTIKEKGYTFIVDPIDGTTNFSRDLPMVVISIALLKDKKPYIAVCYAPYLDELYYAQKGFGAYLNNQKITVSKEKIENGLILVGSSAYYKELRKESMKILAKLMNYACDFRRAGSAVLDLCKVASGQAEIFFELKLQPWDCAAASLLIEEAGGIVTTITGTPINYDKSTSILATNNVTDYLKIIKGVRLR